MVGFRGGEDLVQDVEDAADGISAEGWLVLDEWFGETPFEVWVAADAADD